VDDIATRRADRYLSRRDYRRVFNKSTTLAGDYWSRVFHHRELGSNGKGAVVPWVHKAQPDSGWTVVTVLEYINARISDMELRQQQRFEAQTKAVDAAIIAQRAAVDAALIAANAATDKAEAASDIRFQSVTAIQQSLSERASRLISRDEVAADVSRITERVLELSNRLQDIATKAEVISAFEGVSKLVQSNTDRITIMESRGSGLKAGWSYLGGAIALIATLVAMYVSLHQ
jgi:hypothetical protein